MGRYGSWHTAGCDCSNITPYPFAGGGSDQACVDSCGSYSTPQKPVLWALMIGCAVRTVGGELYGGIPSGIVWLRKECITGNRWVDKWINSFDPVLDPCGVLEPTQLVPENLASPPVYTLNVATWAEAIDSPDVTDPSISKWVLEESYNRLYLSLETCDGNTAQYEADVPCDVTTWPDITLRLVSKTPGVNNLPFCLCLRAIETAIVQQNPCTPAEKRCECCDPGGDTVLADVTFTGCYELAGTTTLEMDRYDEYSWPPAEFCEDLELPENDGCGILWTTLDVGPDCVADVDGATIGILLRCVDGESIIDVYKVNNYGCFEPLAGINGSVECGCAGPRLQIALIGCDEVLCDDGGPTIDDNVGDVYVGDILAIPAGTYTFTRGALLPPEVANGRVPGSCDYFWTTVDYTSECPDTWPGTIGILIDVFDASAFENCPETFEIEGSVDPGECPGNINDYDRASITSFYCKNAAGLFVYAGGSVCCNYFPCGTNPGVSGASLGCVCTGVDTECCPEAISETMTLSDGVGEVELTYRPLSDDFPAGWVGNGTLGECTGEWIVSCQDSDWVVGINNDFFASSDEIVCDPIEVTFNETTFCGGGIPVTLTVTL